MIYVTHPFEDTDSDRLLAERERYARFFTQKIIQYIPNETVLNFPLHFILPRKQHKLPSSDYDVMKAAMEFIGRADGMIRINFPGIDLCERSKKELALAHRLNIPVAEFPFLFHRFDQQYKQNALLAMQKRVLNLFATCLELSSQDT